MVAIFLTKTRLSHLFLWKKITKKCFFTPNHSREKENPMLIFGLKNIKTKLFQQVSKTFLHNGTVFSQESSKNSTWKRPNSVKCTHYCSNRDFFLLKYVYSQSNRDVWCAFIVKSSHYITNFYYTGWSGWDRRWGTCVRHPEGTEGLRRIPGEPGQ